MLAGQLHLTARVGACGSFSDFDCSICNHDPRASEAYGALEEQAGGLRSSPPSVFPISNLGSDTSVLGGASNLSRVVWGPWQ